MPTRKRKVELGEAKSHTKETLCRGKDGQDDNSVDVENYNFNRANNFCITNLLPNKRLRVHPEMTPTNTMH